MDVSPWLCVCQSEQVMFAYVSSCTRLIRVNSVIKLYIIGLLSVWLIVLDAEVRSLFCIKHAVKFSFVYLIRARTCPPHKWPHISLVMLVTKLSLGFIVFIPGYGVNCRNDSRTMTADTSLWHRYVIGLNGADWFYLVRTSLRYNDRWCSSHLVILHISPMKKNNEKNQ